MFQTSILRYSNIFRNFLPRRYHDYRAKDISLIRFIILFPSSLTIIWDTPPAKPNISHAFSDSTSRPRNIELKILSRSPWETMMMFSASSAITWSKKGFSLFHSSRRLSASENRRSSIVFSSHSRFSRNHCTDFPQHRPRLRYLNSFFTIGST